MPPSANLTPLSFSASKTFLVRCFDSSTAIPAMSQLTLPPSPSQIKLPCKLLTFLLDFCNVLSGQYAFKLLQIYMCYFQKMP